MCASQNVKTLWRCAGKKLNGFISGSQEHSDFRIELTSYFEWKKISFFCLILGLNFEAPVIVYSPKKSYLYHLHTLWTLSRYFSSYLQYAYFLQKKYCAPGWNLTGQENSGVLTKPKSGGAIVPCAPVTPMVLLCWDVGGSRNPEGQVVICPLVEIGITDLPKSRRGACPSGSGIPLKQRGESVATVCHPPAQWFQMGTICPK